LADAIRLTVTPLGSSTSAIVPFTATLNTTGTTLTVLPAAALPIGVASLSWGGFSDAAGNAITGTVAASWNVARSSQLGADFHFRFGSSVAFAANAAGVVHAVQQNDGDGNVQVLRFDGSNFVPFGPPVNERAFGTELAPAFERTGVAHVALEQLNAAGTEGEVVVRRYDATLNAWQTLGPAFAMGRPMANSARPRLAVDPANRPVLSFIGSGGAFSLQGRSVRCGSADRAGQHRQFRLQCPGAGDRRHRQPGRGLPARIRRQQRRSAARRPIQRDGVDSARPARFGPGCDRPPWITPDRDRGGRAPVGGLEQEQPAGGEPGRL
ncbi:MAG TPA: hypothetical protein VF319_05005, partial [Caldimonas sp.]